MRAFGCSSEHQHAAAYAILPEDFAYSTHRPGSHLDPCQDR